MGIRDWFKGPGRAPAEEASEDDDAFFGNTIHIPSHDFIGMCARSSNKRFTLAWIDGGPDQSRTGRYALLDGKAVVVEGRMARPNDGQVSDAGIFILNDWGAHETLSGTFNAFAPDGRKILSRDFTANLFNNGLAEDGLFAACQTCNAPTADSNLLTLFDLGAGRELGSFQPESGWAKSYLFFPAARRIRLLYHDGGAFDYGFDGVFIDRMQWLAAGLQKGDVFVIEKLIGEAGGKPEPALAAELIPATTTALAKLRADDGRARARALKSRGICLEAMAELKQALACYELSRSIPRSASSVRRTGCARSCRDFA